MDMRGFLGKKSRLFSIISGFILIGIVGYVDYVSGREISFAILYLVPICFITWYTGRQPGVLAAVASALIWFFDEYTGSDLNRYPAIPFWNAVGMLGFFLVVTYILAELKDALLKEKMMAGVDYLTGAANLRCFSEIAGEEIGRASRYGYPFSVVCFDIDDMKGFNYRMGRSRGDELLGRVVTTLKGNCRKSDTVVRLGGDEFAVLLPETDRSRAESAVAKLRESLSQAMGERGWPVTFTIGVVTFVTPPGSVDDLIGSLDRVMADIASRGTKEPYYIETAGRP